jgi:hypothetical protein
MEIRVLRGAAAHTARNLAALVRVSRGIVQRRTARSSLGMGFIERNGRAAGISSDTQIEDRAVPPPSCCARHLPRADARRRVVDPRDDQWCVSVAGASHPSSAKRGRVGRGPSADVWSAHRRGFKDMLFNTSSLGMGFIEQIADSTEASSGVASRPGE